MDMAASRSIKTTCPYCGVGCGVLAEVGSDGSVSVRGDPDHPANFGRLCSKGSALAETIGLEDRLLFPEVAGVRTSWDRALDLVATNSRKPSGSTGRLGRVLRLRPAPHRGLLHRQQTDEGLHRFGQHRHQLAALHGLLRSPGTSEPSARTRCRGATRISSWRTSLCWLAPISPGATPSFISALHGEGEAARIGRHRGFAPADQAGRRRGAVLGAAAVSRAQPLMWPSAKYCSPGSCSSSRMATESAPPTRPPTIANVRYIVPMSLWLVENSQRSIPYGA